MTQNKRFFSEREVEAVIGIRATTLRRWRIYGKGPPYRKLCGSIKYNAEDLERWLEGCPRGPSQQA